MNLRLSVLKFHIPAFIKKKKLDELFGLTALAFGCDPPEEKSHSYKEKLKSYAIFTRNEAEKCLDQGMDCEEVERKLFQSAYRLGLDIRRQFRLRSSNDTMAMSRILYRILGIDFEGRTSGDVTISGCFFSRYYSPRVCRLISSLDAGLAAGLSGGGKLSFSQRITEGKDCCKARFFLPEKEA